MIIQAEFLAALTIGFFGSLHCLGMCGPIALITPSLYPGVIWRAISGLVYNFGRIVTYTFLGGIIGSIGKGLGIFKWQQGISLVIGVIILISVLIPSIFSANRTI